MKYIIILISFLGLLNIQVLAQEVDFSQTYTIIPAPIPPTEETEGAPPTFQVGGIKTTTLEEDDGLTTFYWLFSLSFNPVNTSCHVEEAIPQNQFEPELLQRRLHGTVWRGDYKTVTNLYSTELQIKSVQAGFIGGELIHTSLDKPEPSGFLHVKVVGNITTQYLINQDNNEEPVWLDVSKYQEIVADIQVENDEKMSEIEDDNEEKKKEILDKLTPIPTILDSRHLIRLNRSQSLEKARHPTSRWGTNNEYRLTLENNHLFGNVGTPPESYGSEDALTGIGEIELTLVTPNEVTPTPPTLE